ncbi:MAG TPA: ATP synthase F0 subunit B [Blastocatellia bacterium]
MFGPTTLALEGNLISPDGSLAVAFLLFILFCFVMNRLLFKPIGRVLDQRSRLTDGARAEARAEAAAVEARTAEYEAALRHARGESYRYLEQQRQLALEDRGRRIDQAKQEAVDAVEHAKEKLAGQVGELRSSLEQDSHQIAREITRTVLGRVVEGGAD